MVRFGRLYLVVYIMVVSRVTEVHWVDPLKYFVGDWIF